MPRNKDYTGQKYQMLTFIQPTSTKSKSGRIMWELLCDCGKTCFADPSKVIPHPSKLGKKSCGCTLSVDLSVSAQKIRRFSPKESTARLIWRQTYSDAEWEIFYSLSQKPCHYCGALPFLTRNKASSTKSASAIQREQGDFTYNGLDRIDSSKPHIASNVVPCCSLCNRMKSDMSYEDFRQHILRLHAHWALRTQLPSETLAISD